MIALVAAAVYFGGRILVEGDRDTAARNAERILRFEGVFGLDIERSVQDLVVDRPVLRTLGNLSYVWLHWPLLIGVMLILWRVDQLRFRQLRNTLIASSLVGLALFTVFPAAPPRFMPGYEGTVSDDARRHYLDYPLSWTNQVASFPSFHVGWTLVACVAIAATLGQPWMRAAAMVPAVLVGMAVVTTGNHYLVDAVAGFAISVAAWISFERPHRRRMWADPVMAQGPSVTGDDTVHCALCCLPDRLTSRRPDARRATIRYHLTVRAIDPES